MLMLAIFLGIIIVIIVIFQLKSISKIVPKYNRRAELEEVGYECLFGTVLLAVIITISIFVASMVYPKLLSKKATAISLRSEIIRIKKSYYPQKSSGKFIGGSLDNMKQSTALSMYIAKYAKAKAKFNASLAKNKAICSMPIYWIFGSNIVMDCNAITNMKSL